MDNVSKILKFIGLIVIASAFFNNVYDYSRLYVVLLGIIIIFISLIIKEKKKITKIVFIPIIVLGLSWLIDSLLVYNLNRKPIFAYRIISSDKFVTYNSIGYRIYECENKTYTDLFYKKSNYCHSDFLDTKDINTLSSEIVDDFKNYKNKFIVFDGKVSYKEGNNIIELKSYNSDVDSINGNVIFNDNIIYKFEFNNLNNIEELKLYDNVKIVGRITKIKKHSDNYIIYVKDAYIPNAKLYNNYKINIVEDKKCQKDKTNYVTTKETNYYTSCLTNIYVVYSEDEVYELSYVLKDEKIVLNDLLTGYIDLEEKEIEDIKNKLYIFEEYNILVCSDNKNIIIGNDKLNLESNYCEVSDVDEEEL